MHEILRQKLTKLIHAMVIYRIEKGWEQDGFDCDLLYQRIL